LHPVFAAITSSKEDDPDTVRQALEAESGGLEASDETGMTPLMHAAWKSKAKVVKMLLDRGADANGGQHEHSYTALHFAALAGSQSTCAALLEAGADTEAVNGVRRTPAQMAAFVGQSRVVAVINNFVPRESVNYWTRKQPFQEKARLSKDMAKPLHNLVMSVSYYYY